MEDKLVEFAGLLRRNGVRVSVSELIEAVRACALVGVGERELFREALRATMVKRAIDEPLFDQFFELYFGGLGGVIKSAAEAARPATAQGEREFQEFLEQIEQLLARYRADLPELGWALLRDDSGRVEKLLRQAVTRIALERAEGADQLAHLGAALSGALGIEQLRLALARMVARLEGVDGRAQWEEYVGRRMRALEEIIGRYVSGEWARREPHGSERLRLRQLAEKSFAYLTDEELAEMNAAVTRLAQRLRNVVALRRRRARRTRFDSQRTLRRNLSRGGVPFELVFSRRRRERPQIVVLCDISDSVRNVSRFMLHFVHALQDLYSRVRSFVFVAEIGEVTAYFRDHQPQEAMAAALSGEIINVYAHSNFGRAFKLFVEGHLEAITRKTTVIVLGDARNNYNAVNDWCLREVRRRARQLIWLNPESHHTWGFGDSEMARYGQWCDVVQECRNLNQLYRVVDRLVAA
ncbi:MAG TPA: VWA domain-containing protein [Candidatus Binataceae bacterium]|nr:VWA domain-containing protein [Candidatus Binataceae bacterium]